MVGNISQGMVVVEMGVLQKNTVESLGHSFNGDRTPWHIITPNVRLVTATGPLRPLPFKRKIPML